MGFNSSIACLPDSQYNYLLKLILCLKKDIPVVNSVIDDKTYYYDDFTSTTDCLDGELKYLRFRVFYNGVGDKLVYGTEWEYMTNGGFTIINNSSTSRMNGWSPTNGDIFHVEVY